MLFICPVAVANNIERTRVGGADAQADFGEAVRERVGVPNRRAAFGVKSLEWVPRIDARREAAGITVQIFYDRLPANWRYMGPGLTP